MVAALKLKKQKQQRTRSLNQQQVEVNKENQFSSPQPIQKHLEKQLIVLKMITLSKECFEAIINIYILIFMHNIFDWRKSSSILNLLYIKFYK